MMQCGSPTLSPDHPSDEDLPPGTPVRRKDGARSIVDFAKVSFMRYPDGRTSSPRDWGHRHRLLGSLNISPIPLPFGMRVFMFNRREFMAAGALAGAAVAASCTGCRRTDYGFLSAGDALALTAICDQIIPADDFPSASEAGVLTYIDRQLGHHYRRHQAAYREGLKQAAELARSRFGVDLAHASGQQQLEVVRAIEEQNKAFFDLILAHTMQGFYGDPRHGGNRDAASWKMLGCRAASARAPQCDLSGVEAMKHVNAVIVSAPARAAAWWPRNWPRRDSAWSCWSGASGTRRADCRKDDLRNQRTTILGNAFGPDDEGNPRVLVDERGRERVAQAQRRRL